MRKIQTVINRPFYVGFCVLELSKLLMYEFHYEYIKLKYPGNLSQLLFTDTDSLMYLIYTENIYNDFWADREHFDFSGFPETSDYHSTTNKKVIGKMKDETSGDPIIEFVGLRPKMYSFVTVKEDNELVEKHTTKGNQKAASKLLRHIDFRLQLDLPHENYVVNRRFANRLHQVYTQKCEKRGLCAYDDKRYMKVDGVHTLAYGHKDIKNSNYHPEPPAKNRDIIQSAEQGASFLARREGFESRFPRVGEVPRNAFGYTPRLRALTKIVRGPKTARH